MLNNILPDNSEKIKNFFCYMYIVTIIVIILVVSEDEANKSSRYCKNKKQSKIIHQINRKDCSWNEEYTNSYYERIRKSEKQKEKEKQNTEEDRAEELIRLDLPKLERYRLSSAKKNKKVGRKRKKSSRKLLNSQDIRKHLNLCESKVLGETKEQKNISKAKETIQLQKKKEMKRAEYLYLKQRIFSAVIVVIIALIAVSFLNSTVAAENIVDTKNTSMLLMTVTALPITIAAPPNLEISEQKIQSGENIFSSNSKIFRERYKIKIEEQLMLYKLLYKNREKSSREILTKTYEIKIEISISQVNRIRKEWGLSRKKGRPRTEENSNEQAGELEAAIQSKAGVQLFSMLLDENEKYKEPLNAIKAAIKVYQQVDSEEDFRLLHSREETISKKWKALTLLSLLGINRLSQLDYQEHELLSVLDFHYSYSTLSQFLGELERIDAGYFLNLALSIDAKGEYCYIDTHKIAYYSRKRMHKGMVTNKGKVMAGSCALIAHDQNAQAIAVEYHPPDTHMSQVIEEFCAGIVEVTGISNFVIDREINSCKTARLFIANDWELICLLAANEYKGTESFKKHFSKELEDGTRLYKASWKEYREDDPRKFIVAKKPNKVIAYWSTPKLFDQLTGEQVVNTYCNRTEIQENSLKDMKMHGALDVNYGRKTISGIDRTHQRKVDKLNKRIEKQKIKLEKIQNNIIKQNRKVTQSILKRYRALLITRQNKLQQYQQKELEIQKKIEELGQQKNELGSSGQREDRDFRKQQIMTCRTAWLENQLKLFINLLSQKLDKPVDIETIISLFFHRTAIVIEAKDRILYKFNTKGLSPKFQNILKKLIDGFNCISLCHRGKKVLAEPIEFT